MDATNKDLYPDMPQADRLEAMKNIAVREETDKIRRYYTPDERQQLSESVTDDTNVVLDKKEEFAVIKKEFDKAIKERQDQIKSAARDHKRGFSENDEPVFLIDDQDAGVMRIYDQWGKFVRERKLYPDERQVTVLQMANTGTDNG